MKLLDAIKNLHKEGRKELESKNFRVVNSELKIELDLKSILDSDDWGWEFDSELTNDDFRKLRKQILDNGGEIEL